MIHLLEAEIIKATSKVDNITKHLLNRVTENQIAIINHQDIDEEAANGLIEKKVAAVINFSKSISGRFPVLGVKKLLDNQIPVFDVKISNEKFNLLHDETEITVNIKYGILYFFSKSEGEIVIPLMMWTKDKWRRIYSKSKANLENELDKFIDNTLEYAKYEKEIVLDHLVVPTLNTNIKNRPVLIVIRGNNYRKDLSSLKKYINEKKPVLIGVDGGADALIEFGYRPDIIIGDMDSVTDEALKSGAELIVHAYISGNAPGLRRIKDLKLSAHILTSIGTSEDIAMLLAYEKKADLIVTVGAHTNMIDFLEKGRKGMASTLLVRMKVGQKLIDARGISLLHED